MTSILGAFQWEQTGDVILHYQQHIPDLDSGTAYQIRVVSKNGADQEAPAEWQEFVTIGVGEDTDFCRLSFLPVQEIVKIIVIANSRTVCCCCHSE